MENKQNSSIDWLVNELDRNRFFNTNSMLLIAIIDEARQMHRSEIEAAYVAKSTSDPKFRKIFEQQAAKYFEDTFVN